MSPQLQLSLNQYAIHIVTQLQNIRSSATKHFVERQAGWSATRFTERLRFAGLGDSASPPGSEPGSRR